MSADLTTLSLTQISSGLAEKKFTSRAVLSALLERISRLDSGVKAFLALDEADALARADASDARRAAGTALGPLDGVPVAIKDNIAVGRKSDFLHPATPRPNLALTRVASPPRRLRRG